jgi:site-specific recombinase XerD
MTGHDICRMFKRYIRRADLPDNLSPHSLRVSVATDLLEQNVTLADVQYLLGHADPRTTRLYDRRQKSVSRNLVERIRLGR